jgi:hypothetical protein
VAASLEPSASVSLVAREAGIHASQLYGWRRQLLRRSQPASSFAAVQIAAEPAPTGLPARGLIEVEFANGSRMRITGASRGGDGDGGDVVENGIAIVGPSVHAVGERHDASPRGRRWRVFLAWRLSRQVENKKRTGKARAKAPRGVFKCHCSPGSPAP